MEDATKSPGWSDDVKQLCSIDRVDGYNKEIHLY